MFVCALLVIVFVFTGIVTLCANITEWLTRFFGVQHMRSDRGFIQRGFDRFFEACIAVFGMYMSFFEFCGEVIESIKYRLWPDRYED